MLNLSPGVSSIRAHYDALTPLYRRFWGPHIHHGYWEKNENGSPARAPVRLIERLAGRAEIPPGARVLDVGCGIGGSSLWLAKNRGCSVLGLTLSPVQTSLAAKQAVAEGVGDRVRFEVKDANALDLPPGSFDAVWVIECSEHLYDKPKFIAACARLLKPGGALALCAWLLGEKGHSLEGARLVADICDRMLCPSLGSCAEYERWMKEAGFKRIVADDITENVKATWDHCCALARRPSVRAILKMAGEDTRRFVGSFEMMRRAYATGAMAYGMMTAVTDVKKMRPTLAFEGNPGYIGRVGKVSRD